MTNFVCPVCKNALEKRENSLICQNGHCFDISRKGTVNLLRSNKSSHGDDKLMVSARKSFLDKGYYAPLMDAVSAAALSYAKDGCTVLDCGCGECYYTAAIAREIRSAGISADIIGIDVSKEAVSSGASRHAGISLAVASVYDIPLPDKSTDIVVSLFAPFAGSEYLRVLKEGGIYITAFPLEDHLFELKQTVYDTPYRNEVSPLDIEGFELLESHELRFTMELSSNADIIALFEMTPYCYKTSRDDRAKLDHLDSLCVTAEFGTAAYRSLCCPPRRR